MALNIIEKAKIKMNAVISSYDYNSDPYGLRPHLSEMERWANYMCDKSPDLNKEVVMLSVWLHDIGYYPIKDKDHAVRSEEIAKDFFEYEKYQIFQTVDVLHCIRAHRNNDVLPRTEEAKAVVFIDSASHITDFIYFRMIKEDNMPIDIVQAKMARDLADLDFFPEIKDEIIKLYDFSSDTVEEYGKINIKKEEK